MDDERRINLLGQARDPEGVRGERPAEAWRGDALAGSPHARLADLVAPPRESFDEAHAEALCAAVTRTLLGDFAPALVLLPERERRRAQAVAALAWTLFDFARQRGLEGDRLAQINRWEFTLERALGGERVGQPIFLRLAAEEKRRAFARDGFDRLFAAARRRAAVERPADAAEADAALVALGEALATTLLGADPPPSAAALAAGLCGLRSLTLLPEELAAGRSPLPRAELPEIAAAAGPQLEAALAAALRRIRPQLLRGARAAHEVTLTFRRAGAYLLLAGSRLLGRGEELGARLLTTPLRLGARERLWLVARARWGRLAPR